MPESPEPTQHTPGRLVPVRTRGLTAYEEAALEVGRKLYVESIEVGRDLCKTMTPVAIGAIPVYLAILGVAAGPGQSLTLGQALVASLAPIAFLVSSALFAFGSFPVAMDFVLDRPDTIEQARQATIRHRRRASLAAFAVFACGVVASVAATLYFFAQH